MIHKVRTYVISGLFVWLPIMATLLVLRFIIEMMDKSLQLLPTEYQPVNYFGFHIPGFGVVLSIFILFFTGMLVTNFLGRRLEKGWDRLISRIPLVSTIHASVKQMLRTLFSSGSKSFRKVLLIEYPRPGLWSLAFQTGQGSVEARDKIGNDLLTVFVPTTPNPTSGFLMMIKSEDAIELEMSVDKALKMIISLGVVLPEASDDEHVLDTKTNK